MGSPVDLPLIVSPILRLWFWQNICTLLSDGFGAVFWTKRSAGLVSLASDCRSSKHGSMTIVTIAHRLSTEAWRQFGVGSYRHG